MKDKMKYFIKNHLSFSLRSFMVFISIIILLAVLGTVSLNTYYSTVGYILDKIDNSITSNLLQTSNRLESELTQIYNITGNIASDKSLHESIKNYEENSDIISKASYKTEIEAILSKMKTFNSSISTIVVTMPQATFYIGNEVFYNITSKELNGTVFMERFVQGEENRPVFFEPDQDVNEIIDNSGMKTLKSNYSFGCPIVNGDRELGFVFLLIRSTIFDKVLRSSDNFLILGGESKVVWKGSGINTSDIQSIKKNLYTGNTITSVNKLTTNEFNAYITHTFNNNWKIISIMKKSTISRQVSFLKISFVVAFFIVILAAIFFSRFFSEKLTKPIKLLLKVIHTYKIKDEHHKLYNDSKASKTTLREGILFFLIWIVIIPAVLYIFFTYSLSSRIIRDYVIEMNKTAFNQTTENLQYYLDSKMKILSRIIFDSTIQDKLSKDTSSLGTDNYKEQENSMDLISEVIDNSIKMYEGRDEISIIGPDGEIILPNDNSKAGKDLSDEILQKEQKKSYNIFLWQETSKDEYGRIMANVLVRINNFTDYTTIGYLDCSFHEYYLENIYKNIIKDDVNVFIVNENNTIISHPNKNLINTKFNHISANINDDNYFYNKNEFIFKVRIGSTPWYLVGQYNNSIFIKDIRQFIYNKIYILIIIIFSVILVATMMSYSLTSAINKMNRLLKRFGIDNMEIVFPEESSIQEIRELGASFNEMVLRTESLLDQLLISTKKQNELETKRNEAEMTALQAQINPHFIYNTFESINSLIAVGDSKNAMRMINSLSDMLRFVAASGNAVVTISEELLYVQTYVEIMKMRFGENISFNIHRDESILQYKTIKLILQPVIENAIYHGINVKQNHGVININCMEADSEILFIIYDNGAGMEPEQLRILNDILKRGDFIGKIGLCNVQNRLKLFYGNKYGIKIESSPQKGTVVEIRIPKAN